MTTVPIRSAEPAMLDCAIVGACSVKPHLSIVTRTVREALAAVSLAELAGAEGAVPQFEDA